MENHQDNYKFIFCKESIFSLVWLILVLGIPPIVLGGVMMCEVLNKDFSQNNYNGGYIGTILGKKLYLVHFSQTAFSLIILYLGSTICRFSLIGIFCKRRRKQRE